MFRAPLCPSTGVQGCTLLYSAVHSVEVVFRKTTCALCTRPASWRHKTPASTLGVENHMQYCTALHS